jgi:hypothetical protein
VIWKPQDSLEIDILHLWNFRPESRIVDGHPCQIPQNYPSETNNPWAPCVKSNVYLVREGGRDSNIFHKVRWVEKIGVPSKNFFTGVDIYKKKYFLGLKKVSTLLFPTEFTILGKYSADFADFFWKRKLPSLHWTCQSISGHAEIVNSWVYMGEPNRLMQWVRQVLFFVPKNRSPFPKYTLLFQTEHQQRRTGQQKGKWRKRTLLSGAPSSYAQCPAWVQCAARLKETTNQHAGRQDTGQEDKSDIWGDSFKHFDKFGNVPLCRRNKLHS